MGARTKHGLPGIYNSSALTLADGDGAALALNSSGILQAYEAYLQAGEDLTNNLTVVELRYSYNNITSQTTTTVKSGAGFLHAINFNKPLASGSVVIYDNTAGSGTTIGSILFPAVLLTDVSTYAYNVLFGTGLTIVTSGATQDITVSYR